MEKVIDWWFRSVVWPFGEWSGLDDFQSQAALTGGLFAWFLFVGVLVLWWTRKRRWKADSA